MTTLIFILLSLTLRVHAVEPKAAEICKSTSLKAFIQCLLREHPEAKMANLLEERAEGEKSDGRKFLNPEVEYESVKGKFLGDSQGSNRIAVSYPIELFGQRGSRVDMGDAVSGLTRVEQIKSQNEVFMGLVLKLYRYRQILSEVEVIEEGLSALTGFHRLETSRVPNFV